MVYRTLCQLIIGSSLEDFSKAPIRLYRRLIDHHQLRWLHDGVFRMAAGGGLKCDVGFMGQVRTQAVVEVAC